MAERMENNVLQKSKRFALEIVRLYKYLTEEKHEFVLSKQLLRCGTSIGANLAEAEHAQTRADWYAKLKIADKEASETDYWIDLLHDAEYITDEIYVKQKSAVNEILSILCAICKKAAG